MPTHFIIGAMILLSGCQIVSEQVITTHYSDVWETTQTTPPSSVTPNRPTPQQDPNYIAISKTAGNQEYLLADSIKQENGIITATVEYRYAKPQTLPNTGAVYHYNHWHEQIDCTHQIRTIRTTTHYNAAGDIIDANQYPAPNYTDEQRKLLAQPQDKLIQEVCQRIGITPEKKTQT